MELNLKVGEQAYLASSLLIKGDVGNISYLTVPVTITRVHGSNDRATVYVSSLGPGDFSGPWPVQAVFRDAAEAERVGRKICGEILQEAADEHGLLLKRIGRILTNGAAPT